MPRALSSVRLDRHATFRYVLFIEGLPYAYTTDSTGALWGSGVGSWAYSSELGAGAREVAGTRIVRRGLVVPDSVTFEIDIKSGTLQPSAADFQILDYDNELVTLFASEGQTSAILAQRIAPGTTDLGVSVQTLGGGTTNPRGQYIGIEKIGPDGERRQWPAIPFDLVGYDHPVHAGASPPDGLAPVLVSEAPLEHAGRMVTLYRIYRDPDSRLADSDPDAYYTWAEAEAAGDRVWWGVLRDSGQVAGSRMWSLTCEGPDAFLRKTLGSRTTMSWSRLSAELTFGTDEDLIAIGFGARGVAGASVEGIFDGRIFDAGDVLTDVSTRHTLAAQINTWIEEALVGTNTNTSGTDGAFDTWVDAAGNANPDAGITSEGVVFIRRNDDLHDDLTYGILHLAMHGRTWRKLGWEPQTQHRDTTVFSDLATCSFERLTAGETFITNAGTGVVVPADGYWLGTFTTIRPGGSPDNVFDYCNSGAPREWYPRHTSEVFVLDNHGGQVLRLINEEPNALYLEGQLTAGYSQFGEVDGTAVERARYFAIRGPRVRVEDDPSTDEIETSDAVERYQVCQASWADGTFYGTVSEGTGIEPALYLEALQDPRSFGVNDKRMTASWAGKLAGKGGLEIAPLSVYHYFITDAPIETADAVLVQILLSTGACAGYDAAIDNGGSIAAGPNTHTSPAPPLFCGDYELADLGLGIPYQLIDHPNDIRAAFDTAPGGWAGDLCRTRLAYLGPFTAADALESLTRPRLLCWSLADKTLGLFRLGPVSPSSVDLAITEDSIEGTPGEPATTIPDQSLRATGQLDGVNLSYRWQPIENSPAAEFKLKALDSNANRRSGDLIETVIDHGLVPVTWYPDGDQEALTGVTDWRPHARQLWQHDAPAFFARRHYAARFRLTRPLGQDAMPGSSIRLTNRWLVSPTGAYGVAEATGRIVRAVHNLQGTCATDVEAIVFATAANRHYAPFVRVSGVTSNTVTWYEDNLAHGGSSLDGTGFAEPDWSSTGGDAQATVYQRTGNTWAAIVTRGIVSVDTAARTVTLDGAVTGYLRDKDHIVVLSDYASQDAGSWPLQIFGVTADTDLTIGDATTAAIPFLS